MSPRIYLDNNAGTAIDPAIVTYLSELLPTLQGNPASTHSFGREAKLLVNGARDAIASFLKVKPTEIIFTSGGTEGAHVTIRALLATHSKGHIITSEAEHSCIYQEMKRLSREGFDVTFLNPGPGGTVDPQTVLEAITPETKLIAIMYANNETGAKSDIAAIAGIARQNGVPLLVDAVAALGKDHIEIPAGVAAMMFSGHKIHVPAGIGFVYINSAYLTKAAKERVGLDGNLRLGTENLLGIAALYKGIEHVRDNLDADIDHMVALRDHFEKTLRGSLPAVTINGSEPRVANVSNVCFHGVDGESLLIALDQHGIAASHGAACSSGAMEPSRVLLSMGLPLEAVRSSVRFSFSRMTTREEIDTACKIILEIVHH